MSQTESKPARRTQGMNWIRKDKRLAIYIRDGLACVYCGRGVEDGAQLTLDHIRPYSKGGKNTAKNLVTCCHTCNSARGDRPWREWLEAVAQYLDHGLTFEALNDHIRACLARELDRKAAQELIDRRGSWSAALRG